MIPVTHITSYLYCPRKFYLEKIKGLKQPPTKQMVEGRIRHNIREAFSNNEKDFIISFIKMPESIEREYQKLLHELIHNSFLSNSQSIKSFSIPLPELKNKILASMKNDIFLRAETIEKSMSQGFFGPELWQNLKPKYISELYLESPALELKGRIDRVMISPNAIVPFELKTREIEKIYESDEIQLTCYAMLLEEKYNQQISLGILEAGSKKYEIPITKENKNKVMQLIEEINQITDNPKFPSNFSKCQSCPWQEQCEQLGNQTDF